MPGFLEMPDIQTVPVDRQTVGLINQQVARSQNPDEFSGALNKGVGETSHALRNETLDAQSDATQASNPGMSNAIRQAYSQRAGKALNKTLNANNFQAQLDRSNYMQTVSAVTRQQQQAYVQQQQALADSYMQNEAARSSFISSLFQVGSTAAGMYGGSKTKAPKTMKTQQGPVGGWNDNSPGGQDYSDYA